MFLSLGARIRADYQSHIFGVNILANYDSIQDCGNQQYGLLLGGVD
jgi:hypothetical protein